MSDLHLSTTDPGLVTANLGNFPRTIPGHFVKLAALLRLLDADGHQGLQKWILVIYYIRAGRRRYHRWRRENFSWYERSGHGMGGSWWPIVLPIVLAPPILVCISIFYLWSEGALWEVLCGAYCLKDMQR